MRRDRGRGARVWPRTRTSPSVLTTFDEDASLAEALRAGVSGFLLKVAPPEQLLHAITVAARNGLLDPAVTLRVMAASARSAEPDPRSVARLATLTARETDVLRLVAEGLTNAEIAGALYLGEATVKTYLSRSPSSACATGCRPSPSPSGAA